MGSGGAGVPLREIALIIFVACAVTFLCTGVVRYCVVRLHLVADIRARDVHTVPKPQLGGLAMFVGFVVAVFVARQLPALTRGFMPVTPEMRAVVVAAFAIVVVGVIDDIIELDALTKFIGQIGAALLLSLLGVTWTTFSFPASDGTSVTIFLDRYASTIFTVLVTLVLVNAMNFIDGLDGLASGIGMIGALAILAFSLTVLHDQGGAVSAYPPSIISAALAGACAGFLPHNFTPARIFMGDTGSMLIGVLLAAATTSVSGKMSLTLYGAQDAIAVASPLILGLMVCALPGCDLLFAIVRRLRKHQSIFSADRKHVHHQLLRLGHSQRQVALVLYTWTGALAFGVVSFSIIPASWATAFVICSLCVAIFVTARPIVRKKRTSRLTKL